jgi:sugar lactone lactonase YvrE
MLRKSIGCVLVLLAAGPCFGQDMKLTDILIPGEGWKEAAKGLAGIRWLQAEPNGDVLVAHGKGLERIDRAGKSTSEGKTAAEKTVTARGYTYSINKVKGPERPAGLVLWPDGGTLVVGDAGSAALWAFRIDKDGKLTGGDRYYYPVRSRPGHPCGVSDLAVDKVGRVYAATTEGVQVFDPTGRLIGVLTNPAAGEISGVALGGPDGDTLFVGCGDKVYARKTKARAVWAKDSGK